MAEIKVSAEIHHQFEELKKALKALYPWQEIKDDEIMWAMIGGFFDSLTHMQQHAHTHHHHGDDHACCGEGKCKDDGECKCK